MTGAVGWVDCSGGAPALDHPADEPVGSEEDDMATERVAGRVGR